MDDVELPIWNLEVCKSLCDDKTKNDKPGIFQETQLLSY